MADVRVRLTPEGVAEVVAALRTTRTEAEKTGKVSVQSVNGIGAAVNSVRRSLAALGVALSIGAFTQFVQGSTDLAESQLNVAKSIGASVQATRQLGIAAKVAGTDIQSLTSILGRFNKEAQSALEGDPEAQGLFRAIGLTRQELEKFKTLDAAGRLQLVADAFSRLPDGPAKSAAAFNLFGKNAAAIIPLLDQLAREGLPELGFQIKEETLKASAALGDQFDLLNAQTQALAIQFTAGLAPALQQTLAQLNATPSDAEGVLAFGFIIGKMIATIIAGLKTIAIEAGFAFNAIVEYVFGTVEAVSLTLQGKTKEAEENWKVRLDTIKSLSDQAAKDVGDTWRAAFSNPAKTFGPSADEFFAQQRAKALAALSQAQSDQEKKRSIDTKKEQVAAELEVTRAGLKLREEEEQRSFEAGLESVKQYYNARRQIVADAANAEILALQKKRTLTEADPTVKNKPAELAKLDGAIAQVVAQREAQLADLTNKEAADQKKLAQERLELDRQIFEARGQQHAAELVRIQEEIDKADELLKKSGASPDEAEAKLNALREGLNQQLAFNEASKKANEEITSFSRERDQIQDQVNAGLLGQAEAEQRILKLERDRVDALEAIGEELLKAADATGDEEKQRQAQDFLRQVSQIRLSLRAADSPDLALAAQGLDTVKEGLVDLAATGQSAGQSFSQAMAQTASSVVASLRRITAQIIATKIFTSLLSIFGGGVSGKIGSPTISGDIAPPQVAAEGGMLHGAGTGTSDSNLGFIMPGARPLLFSDSEFVTRAAVVRQPGALAFLHDFNRRGMPALADLSRYSIPRFADGGPIGDLAAGAGAGSAGGDFNGRLDIGLDSDLLVSKLTTSRAMERFVVRTVLKNRATVRRGVGAIG